MSPSGTAQEKVTTAVAPPSAAHASNEHAELDSTAGISSKDSELPPIRFVLPEKVLDDAFNDIWANNANAISHCYSNTDALKVDFTRTGKRSFLGMISEYLSAVTTTPPSCYVVSDVRPTLVWCG